MERCAILLNKSTQGFACGNRCYSLKLDQQAINVTFPTVQDLESFEELFNVVTERSASTSSTFDKRTDKTSSAQYFQYYGFIYRQQQMLEDHVRTSTYQRACLENKEEFQGKVVLDVGAGTGILSYFAAQAGARKVYAVEASNMAKFAKQLTINNKLDNVVEIVCGKVEEISLPEKVDIIISEPMGYLLFNERMCETYLHAKKWLKPQGNMYPTTGDIFVAPFTDERLFRETTAKADFWCKEDLYGVNISSLYETSKEEYFSQPIVDKFDVETLLSEAVVHKTNFLTAIEEDLHKIDIPLEFIVQTSGTIHGLAFWFDVTFVGKTKIVPLSTSPHTPLTHWHQVRCLLINPVCVKAGQTVRGKVSLHATQQQSYHVHMELEGSANSLDLKNCLFGRTHPRSI